MSPTNGHISERTPLLPPHSPAPTQSRKRTLQIYALFFGFLAVLVLSVYSIRGKLPQPLSDSEAYGSNDFAGIHSYNEYLSKFQAPHPATTRENAAIQSWLISLARNFQAEGAAKGIRVDLIDDDPTRLVAKRDRFASDEYWMVESRNVMLRIVGSTNRTDEALLVNAHYEGTGAGGRALLFRSDSLGAIQKLASNAHLVHASSSGDSLLKSKVLRSNTDYSLFVADGVPGMDFAFYTPRTYYHTQRDDLVHTTPGALQHMGQMALATLRGIDEMDTMPTEQEDGVYYDILGRALLVYSFTTFQILNSIALVAVPVVAIVWTFVGARELHMKDRALLLAKRSTGIAQGFVAVIIALLCVLATTVVAILAMELIHPMFTYGNAYEATLYVAVAAFFGLLVAQVLCDKLAARLPKLNLITGFDEQCHALVVLWWFLVVLSVYYGTKQIGSMYYAIYFLVSSAVASTLYQLLPTTETLRLPVVFVVQTLMPFVLMTELSLLTMDALRHVSADGVPELTVYFFMTIPILLIVLQFMPWVRFAGQQRKAAGTAGVALGFLFVMCFFLPVFNGAWSPDRIVFGQEYNATDSLATVSLVSKAGLPSLLHQAFPPGASEEVSCGPYKNQTRCMYQTDLTPLYARDPSKEVYIETSTTCDKHQCHANITTTVQNSVLCQLVFDHEIKQAWVNGELIQGKIGALMSYSRTFTKPTHWQLEYQQPTQARFSCIYDEWTHGELPAFTDLRNRLPESALVTILGGVGLTKVHYDLLDLTVSR
ncbi:hypothetical protein DFQ28_000616 [Apophysomyces sp. BC1034]|nr:hypothetical protein DFQ30_004553 [Apophysomyces sp. BC1015]KAG0180830.1 hypothetical protein DFQ29_010031 [Apophysomyces sp. BC1021]KAG0191277.1 hypothetical protein DFQ28_000616 [Apophysomyces sp. BC1034]